MITTAHALLSEEPDCDADRVREVLSGNLCRCTGYISIVEAVLDARSAYRREDKRRGRKAMRTVNSFIGSPIERLEDLRFLRGRGEYVDDLAARRRAACRDPAQLGRAWPHPLDRCCTARALPGSRRARGDHPRQDLRQPHAARADAAAALPEFEPFAQPVIAQTKVRYVGEALALVLAESAGDCRGCAWG